MTKAAQVLSRAKDRRASAMMLGLLAAFCACASDHTGPPVPVEDLARLLSEGLCNNIGPCCNERSFPYDAAQCRAATEAQLRESIAGYTTPNVSYDAVAARGCVDAYSQMAESCGETDYGDACDAVFTGKLADGATCTMSAECASRNCTSTSPGGAMQCAPGSGSAVHAKVGEACSSTCTTSGKTSSCFSSAGTGGSSPTGACYTNDGILCDIAMHICVPVPAIGQSCATTFRCADGAFCDGVICAAQHTSGSCATTIEACAPSTFCDSTTLECIPRKARGHACSSSYECQTTDDCSGGTCQHATIVTAQLCVGTF